MGIKARENQVSDTPEEVTMEGRVDGNNITVDMILLDLAKGRGREAITKRYFYTEDSENKPFETWMVTKIFKDPSLRNRKATKVKALPFAFMGTPEPVAPPALIEEMPTANLPMSGELDDEETVIDID